jgi:hypothetical protein
MPVHGLSAGAAQLARRLQFGKQAVLEVVLHRRFAGAILELVQLLVIAELSDRRAGGIAVLPDPLHKVGNRLRKFLVGSAQMNVVGSQVPRPVERLFDEALLRGPV